MPPNIISLIQAISELVNIFSSQIFGYYEYSSED